MDTSPVRIVCSNRLDTALEVLRGRIQEPINAMCNGSKGVLGPLTSGLWRSRQYSPSQPRLIRGDGSGGERHRPSTS